VVGGSLPQLGPCHRRVVPQHLQIMPKQAQLFAMGRQRLDQGILGGSMDLGWREKLLMQLRLGWIHEYADTTRPVAATLAGAPAMPFTTFGVAPQRDGVVLGLSANTAIAEATSIYLRYEGGISGQDSAHALTAGVRMTW
jgi:outer membrane autotransporter protein